MSNFEQTLVLVLRTTTCLIRSFLKRACHILAKPEVPQMISVPKPLSLVDELAKKHSHACETGLAWTEIWKLFSDDPWFNRRLDYSVIYSLKRANLPLHNEDDVRQEALLQFARAIQRSASLNFNPSRGEFSAFLATIINRCCQKGVRKVRPRHKCSITSEAQHPLIEYHNQFDEHIDFQELVRRTPEPYQQTLRLICSGLTITEIARLRRKSERTVYRWLEKGINDIRDKLES